MNFHIMTLFPEMVMNGLNTSIIGRAISRDLLSIEAVNIRDFAFNKHQSVDDYPYGGGAGMLMQAEPVYLAYQSIEESIAKRKKESQTENTSANEEQIENNLDKKKTRVVYLSPQGDTFNQKMTSSFYADIMRGLMNVCWRRLLQIMFQSEIMYSQAGNSRLWSWLIQFPDWFRVCCIMMYQLNLNHFRIICLNIHSIQDRKNGMGKKYRLFCCPDIMQI